MRLAGPARLQKPLVLAASAKVSGSLYEIESDFGENEVVNGDVDNVWEWERSRGAGCINVGTCYYLLNSLGSRLASLDFTNFTGSHCDSEP